MTDSAIAKRFTPNAIQKKLAALDPQPDFELQPFTHQAASFLLGLKYPQYGLLLDPGLGKSKVSIDLFRYRVKLKQAKRVLVLVPNSPLIPNWLVEFDKHMPEHQAHGLLKSFTAEQKRELFWNPVDACVLTYAALQSILCKNIAGKRVPVEELVEKAKYLYDMVICDESSALGDGTSLNFRLLNELSTGIKFRNTLTGTPFGSKDVTPLWSQFYFLDHGKTLGNTVWQFKNTYMRSKKVKWGKIWTLKKGSLVKLNETIRQRSIRYTDDECLNLPERLGEIEKPNLVQVILSLDQYNQMNGMWDDLEASHRNQESEQTKLMYHQIRAIVAGFMPTEIGNIPFEENPKLEAAIAKLKELQGHQVILFGHYRGTMELIESRLKDEKIKFASAHGMTNTIDKFLKGKAQVLVANRAASYGLNLQFCNHTMFYENFESYSDRKQAERRTSRQGQTKPCHYMDFVGAHSIDLKIIQALQDKRDIMRVVVDGKRPVLG